MLTGMYLSSGGCRTAAERRYACSRHSFLAFQIVNVSTHERPFCASILFSPLMAMYCPKLVFHSQVFSLVLYLLARVATQKRASVGTLVRTCRLTWNDYRHQTPFMGLQAKRPP